MDWVKTVAVAGSSAYAIEKMLKVFRLWKQTSRESKGLTVKNGEYKDMVSTLGRIEARIDRLVQEETTAFRHIRQRLTSLETRLDARGIDG